MSRKYAAFDIETAKIVPGPGFNWRPHRPLGITCIASQVSGDDEPRLWYSRNDSGQPAGRMSAADLGEFVDFLVQLAEQDVLPLTWNGLAFDFDILAEESGRIDDCRRLALAHVDMMFHVVCEKGFPVALKNAAAGLKVAGKLEGVDGLDAPVLWANGEYDTVLKYVAQDVRATLAVAEAAEHRNEFAWTTRKGTTNTLPLRKGWLTVAAANELPLPDTSWMSSPLRRSDFLAWTRK